MLVSCTIEGRPIQSRLRLDWAHYPPPLTRFRRSAKKSASPEHEAVRNESSGHGERAALAAFQRDSSPRNLARFPRPLERALGRDGIEISTSPVGTLEVW
jgi:hypothetical protein